MESNPLEKLSCPSAAELAQAVFAQKAQRRRSLAALPVEQKFREFLRLQRMVAAVRRSAGRDGPKPWPIELGGDDADPDALYSLLADIDPEDWEEPSVYGVTGRR